MNNKYVEQPMGYWEENSYFQIILPSQKEDFLSKIIDRVEQVEGVNVYQTRDLTEEQPRGIRLTYKGKNYELFYYINDFSFPSMYARGPYYVSEEEIEDLKNAEHVLVLYMNLEGNVKEAFHLQLKIAYSIVPNLRGIIDESAEKLLPRKWVEMTVNSSAIRANDLFTIQAVSNKNNEIWLHTHGLNRCGVSELEILQSSKENYNSHYNLITIYASYLLDVNSKDAITIGYFNNNEPITVTSLSWTKAIEEYGNLTLGNIEDRADSHNGKTSVIFLCNKDSREGNNKRVKLNEVNHYWSNDPLFFISSEETYNMTVIARERFTYLKELAKEKDNRIFIKVKLQIKETTQFEHIYFELISFENDKFKAILVQNPYQNIEMHKGDTGEFSIKDVTDWYALTKLGTITPSNVYLL